MKAKAWNEFINTLHKIDKKAYDNVADYVMNLKLSDFADEYEYNKAIVDYAYAVVTKYGEASASLACQMYEETAKLEGVTVPLAVPANTATYTETAIAVNGARMQGKAVIPNAVSRLVRQAGQDTTLKNALRDGAYFAWIPNGDTCAFCITLASRGWQRISKKALKNGHAEHIHANCDCAYAVSFNGPGNVEEYDPKQYKTMYDAAEGNTPTDKINAMRRAHYAKNRDYINAQKKEAYQRLKSLKNGSKNDTMNTDKYDMPSAKIKEFLLKPGAKHSDEFFNVGYSIDDYEKLNLDIYDQFDMDKAYDMKEYEGGERRFSINMQLGVKEKKNFRTVWTLDPGSKKPRFVTAHREEL